MALYHYHFPVGEGLVTEMNAIRRDEIPDNPPLHLRGPVGLGKGHRPRDRNVEYLKATVQSIVDAMAGHPENPSSPSSPSCACCPS